MIFEKGGMILMKDPVIRVSLEGIKTELRLPMVPQPTPHLDGLIWPGPDGFTWWPNAEGGNSDLRRPPADLVGMHCPTCDIGDILWVKEACRAEELASGLDGIRYRADNKFVPIADTQEASDRWLEIREMMKGQKWIHPVAMPPDLFRLKLEVVDMGVDRLRDMDVHAVHAEGVMGIKFDDLLEMKFPQKTIRAEIEKALTYQPGWLKLDVAGMREAWRWYMVANERCRVIWNLFHGHIPGARWEDNPWVWVVKYKRVTS